MIKKIKIATVMVAASKDCATVEVRLNLSIFAKAQPDSLGQPNAGPKVSIHLHTP
jgi:hypothetical protein